MNDFLDKMGIKSTIQLNAPPKQNKPYGPPHPRSEEGLELSRHSCFVDGKIDIFDLLARAYKEKEDIL